MIKLTWVINLCHKIKKPVTWFSELEQKSKLRKRKFSKGSNSNISFTDSGYSSKGEWAKANGLCFVCYSPNHKIMDCEKHAQNQKTSPKPITRDNKGNRSNKPVWDNTKRVNHKKISSQSVTPKRSFSPKAILTKNSLLITTKPVIAQSTVKPTASQSTVKPTVKQVSHERKVVRPNHKYFSKSNMPYNSRPQPITPKGNKIIYLNNGGWFETVDGPQTVVSKVKKAKRVIKPKQVWKPKGNYLDNVLKDTGNYMIKKFDYVKPSREAKSVVAWVPKRF